MVKFVQLLLLKIPLWVFIVFLGVFICYRVYLEGKLNNLIENNQALMNQVAILKSSNLNLLESINNQNKAIDELKLKNAESELELKNQISLADSQLKEKRMELSKYYSELNLSSKCEDNLNWLKSRASDHRW